MISSLLFLIGLNPPPSPPPSCPMDDSSLPLTLRSFVVIRYAFSHKDYTEADVQSARMPVYYAFRDCIGIQDIIQDSLETLKGTRFTYRTFEPSEGVATVGMSRSGRIMAGLRYSQGGTSKYWLPETTTTGGSLASSPNRHDPNDRLRPSQYQKDVERPPSLYFRDLDDSDDDGMEELYDASKKQKFGDYNFPAIDVHDPKEGRRKGRKGSRSSKKKKKAAQNHPPDDIESHGTSGASYFGKEGWGGAPPSINVEQPSSSSGVAPSSSSLAARDGCIDNVNGYVPEPRVPKSKRSSMSLRPDGPGSSGSGSGSGPNSEQRQPLLHPLDGGKDSHNGPALLFL